MRLSAVSLAFVLGGLLAGLPAGADEPASQPASQPATQPASQPTTQPTTQPDSPPDTQPATQPATAAASQPTTTTTQAAKEKKKERWLAVVGGRVHTVSGPVLDLATVLCKDGVIVDIGTAVQIPQECEVIDATGRYVYPGLVAATAGGLFHTEKPDDATDVFALPMNVALAAGITTAAAGSTAAKLTFGTVENIGLRKDLFIRLGYSRSSPLQRAELRADLEKVRGYLRALEKHEREKQKDADAKPPAKDWLKGKYEGYLKLLKREAVARATAQYMQDLRDLTDLARTFGFDLVIEGAYEGWTVASELGRANVGVIISPRVTAGFGDMPLPNERLNRPSGPTIENAARLHAHGVPVAVVPPMPTITFWGLAGRDLLHLNMEAAFAVRGGLGNEAAIRAITLDAARILRLDDRVGSLDVGKDADLIVCDGDLLHYMTQVHYTIVNGRVAYEKATDTLFAHIRPDGRPAVAQFDDQWPRRLRWPDEEPAASAPAPLPPEN